MPRNIESDQPFPGSARDMGATKNNLEIEKRHNEAANYLQKLTERKADLDEIHKKLNKSNR